MKPTTQPPSSAQQETEPEPRNNALLFKATDAYCKGPFVLTFNAQRSPLQFAVGGDIILLFVIEGEIEIEFKMSHSIIRAGHFLALSEAEVRHSQTGPGTLLLHYNPPCRLAYYLRCCKHAFGYSCSSIVPINQEVEQWAERLMADLVTPASTLDEQQMEQRRKELSECLMRYPSGALGELYVAFYACSSKCSGKCGLVDTKY